jgi:hypothetical protein
MHVHTTPTMAVCCLEDGLSFTNFYAAQLWGKVAYHDFEGITVHLDEGRRILASAGGKPVLLLRNHGPVTIGFSLANEFSDHVTERINYLYLAHSKLRQASFGPELLVGDLPAHVSGTSRIHRGGAVIWEKPFLSGEANMSHSLANLEYHHFKYGIFCQPGDVHVHMFGTATLSFADGIRPLPGDVFEIESPAFGLPLQNPLAVAPDHVLTVRAL